MTEVTVHEPGSVRRVHYHSKPIDGKYPVTYWGTLEEQIAEATARNLDDSSKTGHVMMDLYTMAEYCEHSNPDDMEKYEGLDDMLKAWMAEHHPGLTSWSQEGFWEAQKEGMAAIPLYVEFSAADDEYSDSHNNVCLLSPMGSCCTHNDCTDGDEDHGFEPAPCRRQDHARERQDNFWWRFSPEGIAYMERQDRDGRV